MFVEPGDSHTADAAANTSLSSGNSTGGRYSPAEGAAAGPLPHCATALPSSPDGVAEAQAAISLDGDDNILAQLRCRLSMISTDTESVTQASTLMRLLRDVEVQGAALELWLEYVRSCSTPSRLLGLLYFANDVIQNLRGEQEAIAFRYRYATPLAEAIAIIRQKPRHVVSDLEPKLHRIIKILRQRAVYDVAILDLLDAMLQKTVLCRDDSRARDHILHRLRAASLAFISPQSQQPQRSPPVGVGAALASAAPFTGASGSVQASGRLSYSYNSRAQPQQYPLQQQQQLTQQQPAQSYPPPQLPQQLHPQQSLLMPHQSYVHHQQHSQPQGQDSLARQTTSAVPPTPSPTPVISPEEYSEVTQILERAITRSAQPRPRKAVNMDADLVCQIRGYAIPVAARLRSRDKQFLEGIQALLAEQRRLRQEITEKCHRRRHEDGQGQFSLVGLASNSSAGAALTAAASVQSGSLPAVGNAGAPASPGLAAGGAMGTWTFGSSPVPSPAALGAARRVLVLLKREWNTRLRKLELDQALFWVLTEMMEHLCRRWQRLSTVLTIVNTESERRNDESWLLGPSISIEQSGSKFQAQ